MSYIALYRKWRPLVFEDVVEQEHVVKTLKNSVVAERVAHAYLFCGTRGTGKTTMAKIFSRAINCLQPKDGDPCNECDICKGILSQNILDVVEIDAASNNSVDNIREIRDEVIYAPSQAKYKVYIIDEVHMLSTGAFNALLKTLEEPPSHVVFILATTEPHKLPATILSRCQRFDFRRISADSIAARLEEISQAGGVHIQPDALRLIAKLSDGALRDAISILDQCMAFGSKELDYNDVLAVVGIVNDIFIRGVVEALKAKDAGKIISLVEQLVMEGKDIGQFVADLIYFYRNLLICRVTQNPREIIEASEESMNSMKQLASDLAEEEIVLILKELSQLEATLKWATHPRIMLEVALIKICNSNFKAGQESLHERLAMLEKRLENAAVVPQSGFAGRAAPAEAVSPVRPAEKKPEKKADAPAQAGTAVKAAGEALGIWDNVLGELRKSGRMALFTSLMGAKAVRLDEKQVGIVFGPGSSFNKMMVSKAENTEVVETLISKLLGAQVKIKCVDEEDLQIQQKAPEKEQKDEFMEKAQEIAKKLNVPFEVIDE